jgi:hypothetical protein
MFLRITIIILRTHLLNCIRTSSNDDVISLVCGGLLLQEFACVFHAAQEEKNSLKTSSMGVAEHQNTGLQILEA